jgi:hypothetical protein
MPHIVLLGGCCSCFASLLSALPLVLLLAGAWSALLMSLGFEVCTVHVKSWKKHLGLLSQNKDSSRQLAMDVYSSAGKSQQNLLR